MSNANQDSRSNIRLERSTLMVPASNWAMIQKAANSAADAVCIDLEDAVAPSEKEASRANVVRAFRELNFGSRLRIYRINGLDTYFAYRDLIEVVEEVGDKLDLIIVPKVNRAEDVYWVETLLTQIEDYKKFNNFFSKMIGFILRSDRAACINRIKENGYDGFAVEMTYQKMHSIKK